MQTSTKSKSVVSLLRDRELNIKYAPYFTSLKITSELIRSDNKSLYLKYWGKCNAKEVSYDNGNIFFSNYKEFRPVNAYKTKTLPRFSMEKTKAKKRIAGAILYSGTTIVKSTSCQCELQRCICLSPYLLSISEDNWLCQHLLVNGKLLKEIYVNVYAEKVKFKYCDWDVYGERFILATTRILDISDKVAYLAVFTTFPVEFFALVDIKRSVFGLNVTAYNISNHSLVIGLGSTRVNIYNFDDFIKGGTVTPYKLGDDYKQGVIGSYPTGLPLNFAYTKAPPILFDVMCNGQIIHFGGYPYHYITIHPIKHQEFRITAVSSDNPIILNNVDSSLHKGTLDTLVFHPDQSNRIILTKDDKMEFYKIIADNDSSKLSKLFSIGEDKTAKPTKKLNMSSFGRVIKCRIKQPVTSSCILCYDYDDELQMLAVLVKYSSEQEGYIMLYDSVTGEHLRKIKTRTKLCDSNIHTIHIDLYAIIVFQKDLISNKYDVHVYMM